MIADSMHPEHPAPFERRGHDFGQLCTRSGVPNRMCPGRKRRQGRYSRHHRAGWQAGRQHPALGVSASMDFWSARPPRERSRFEI